MRAIARAIFLVVGFSGAAHGEDERPQPPSTRRKAAAVAASLLPGVLVHGSGHFVLGDRRTARRLLVLEGVGLGLVAAGGGVLGGSGTDENVAILYVPLLVAGVTIVTGTFLADLLGVSIGPIAGAARGPPARLAAGGVGGVGFGYRYVGHPDLDLGHFATARGAIRLAGLSLELSAELEPRGRYRDYGVEAAYRLPWRPGDAELSVGVDGARRRVSTDRFTSTPVAAWGELVWPLGLPRLPGAYARGRLGFGVEQCDYHEISDAGDDWVVFVVANAGLGFRVGRVDLEIDYDQRKDDFPGGLYFGRLVGFMGSVGVTARVPLVQRFSLAGAARYGTGMTGWLELQRSF